MKAARFGQILARMGPSRPDNIAGLYGEQYRCDNLGCPCCARWRVAYSSRYRQALALTERLDALQPPPGRPGNEAKVTSTAIGDVVQEYGGRP